MRPHFLDLPREAGSPFRADLDCSQESNLNKKMKTKNMTTLHLRESINRSLVRRRFLLVPLGLPLAWFALTPTAQVQLPSPTPDGGYPNDNTAEGTNALFSLTNNGFDNTAVGFEALFSNTEGDANTATGFGALFNNTTGALNTATSAFALTNNTTGLTNTATGGDALHNNTSGSDNTATGSAALYFNTTGNDNTATGEFALDGNLTGSNNTATDLKRSLTT
jgi:hypothetical protein